MFKVIWLTGDVVLFFSQLKMATVSGSIEACTGCNFPVLLSEKALVAWAFPAVVAVALLAVAAKNGGSARLDTKHDGLQVCGAGSESVFAVAPEQVCCGTRTGTSVCCGARTRNSVVAGRSTG